jgi:hypothetical protein
MSDFTRGGNTALTRAAEALDRAGYPRDLTAWLRDCAHIVDDGTVGKGKRQPGFSAPWPAPPKPTDHASQGEWA